MPIGSLTPVGLQRFDFVNAATDQGRVPRVLKAILEDIGCDGIDYDLARLNRRTLPPFDLRIMAEASTYDAAEQLADVYEQSVGILATWLRTVQGIQRKYNNVLIKDVTAIRLTASGPISGLASSSSNATVYATFTLQLTEVPK